jgi:MFS transporter, DHA2 family, multidrug resistance protein
MSTTAHIFVSRASGAEPATADVSGDKASLTAWVAVLASMIGAFMAILNIQITNASLLDIEGGIGRGSTMGPGSQPPISSAKSSSFR